MRRKDGKKKQKARRCVPKFDCGFKDSPLTQRIGNASITGRSSVGPMIDCVSMFSGCGGLDLGILGGFNVFGQDFEALPFRITAAYDIVGKAIETYRLNIGDHAHETDLTQVSAESLPRATVLMGGFPCQDFSSCGPKLGLDGRRGRLYRVMYDYMVVHRPEIVIGENVLYLEKLHDGLILRTILSDFESCGYRFSVWRIPCHDFGLPQSRTRLFLIGVRNDLAGFPEEPPLPLFQRQRSIDDAIEDLAPITDETVPNQGQYFVASRATAGAGQGDQTSVAGQIAFTVRANARARIHFHYRLDRRLTVRECARLQSFPDNFVFPHAAMQNMSEIGNAVPPMISHLIGQSIARYAMRHIFSNAATG